ncbi:GntR family transcriptional regulator [Rhodococcus aerolatus]
MTGPGVTTATQRAHAVLRAEILDGTRPAGTRLREDTLAEELGLSRTPVREALARLGTEGLVEHLAHRGARVSSWSAEDLEETFELRAVLEGLGARRAAERATPEDVAGLRALCTRMEQTIPPGAPRDLDALTTLNSRFHHELLRVAGSARLEAMVDAVIHVPVVMRTFVRYSDHALARSQHHHRELCDALEARDGGWAESVMRSHVLAARAQLVPTPAPDPAAQEEPA